MPRDVAESRQQAINKIVHEGKSTSFVGICSGRHIEQSIYPVKDDKGQVLMLAIFCKDISNRIVGEETLKDSEIKFRTMADYTYDWEYWIGADGEIIYMSPSCKRITGYDAEEFIRDSSLIEKIIHPEDRINVRKHKDRAGFQMDIHSAEFRIKRRDGQVRWIGHVCNTVVDKDGKNAGVRVSNRDITDMKEAEAALIDLHARILLKQNALNDKNIALREILDQVETERNRTKKQIEQNRDKIILPLIRALRNRLGKENQKQVELLMTALNEITSPFVDQISHRYGTLTQREVEICNMVRNGILSKEIAENLGISLQTVHKFRQRIRKKLGIANDGSDLSTFLRSLN